jgi:thiol-disulfide isomerase/thioredoxin
VQRCKGQAGKPHGRSDVIRRRAATHVRARRGSAAVRIGALRRARHRSGAGTMSGRRDWLRTVALAAAASASAASARAQPRAGAPADDGPFEWPAVTLLDGTVWTPESWHGLAGVAVVWATWCAYCHRHNPHVEKLFQAVRGRPMRVLGVALDRDPEAVRRHVRERGYTFPMTMGTEPLLARLVLRRVTPTTVSFDRRGRLLQRIPGEMFEDDVLALARLAGGPA